MNRMRVDVVLVFLALASAGLLVGDGLGLWTLEFWLYCVSYVLLVGGFLGPQLFDLQHQYRTLDTTEVTTCSRCERPLPQCSGTDCDVQIDLQ